MAYSTVAVRRQRSSRATRHRIEVEANQTAYTLQYQQPAGQPPVTLVKTSASQTALGQADCAGIGLTL